jgi:hypothetical protein
MPPPADPIPDSHVRAAARALYEAYDYEGAGNRTAWGNMPAHEQAMYIRVAARVLAALDLHKLGKFNG